MYLEKAMVTNAPSIIIMFVIPILAYEFRRCFEPFILSTCSESVISKNGRLARFFPVMSCERGECFRSAGNTLPRKAKSGRRNSRSHW